MHICKISGSCKNFWKRRSLADKVGHIYTTKPSKMLIHDRMMVPLTWVGWRFTLGHNAGISCKVPEPLPRSHPLWKSTTWRIHAARYVCSWTLWWTERFCTSCWCQCVLLLLFGWSDPCSIIHWPPKVGLFRLPFLGKAPWFSPHLSVYLLGAQQIDRDVE